MEPKDVRTRLIRGYLGQMTLKVYPTLPIDQGVF